MADFLVVGAAVNAVAQARAVVNCEPGALLRVLERNKGGLVATTERSGFFNSTYQSLTSYKGIAFFTASKEPLILPAGLEIFTADSISNT